VISKTPTDDLNRFDRQVAVTEGAPPHASGLRRVQVNIGLVCNQKCRHCHVAAGPRRREQMDWKTMQHVVDAARRAGVEEVDITGGAPEIHPDFTRFVDAIGELGVLVRVRTNLTILVEPGYEDRAAFMAERRVALVASLPCYLEKNVDRQRGDGVFDASIRALHRLNELGYGDREELPLELVYNPLGPVLPPAQATLEADYRQELKDRYGVLFTRLLTITNMPIGRFLADLRASGREQEYRKLIEDAFNPATLDGLMCRSQISVGWNGDVYDCDFNLALKMRVDHGAPTHIRDFHPDRLARRRVVTARHCFGCTAGAGSSCGGALV
jgi:radical SAM/Cys-rich protein